MIFTDLSNRLLKRHKHLKKWAKRNGITCYRLYERDLPDHPIIVDWYDGDCVAWISPRTIDDTPELRTAYDKNVIETLSATMVESPENLYIKTRKIQKGLTNQYSKLTEQKSIKQIVEHDIIFEVNLSDYLDTGLFLDHRPSRRMIQEESKGKRVLNLFAYTGSFTCYARAGEAISTTSVDLSSSYLDWAKRNMTLNFGAPRKSDRFIKDNCLSFIKQEASQNRYDIIICDPPTFSNSKSMKENAFSIDEDYPELISDCIKLLAPEGFLLFSTNSRKFKLDPQKLPKNCSVEDVTTESIPEDFRNKNIHKCWVIGKGT